MELLELQEIGNKLTRKQRKFAHSLIKHGNGARAAREAGYSVRSATQMASENLTKPNIREYIDQLEAQQFDVEKLTPELIKKMLLEDAFKAKEGSTRVRAKELLGKTQGMFKDVQVTETDNLNEAQLLDMVRRVFGDELADEAAKRLGVEVLADVSLRS